ncbi:hypothetical protein BDZ90DRAFT_99779 [Jaminaea rosea]|uniref:Uncharacterized protein n=1 Tax=Jaminaea rosea TaxID=1569628 RepID=A0A316UJM8_9BASI|nr:hypothetical protein BDZ90DRAFT_99779 [Jaminaea rosea]PWN24551.1 hypothetical protein BDZ90DRAFT_99779 [Jaminaea rosea]
MLRLGGRIHVSSEEGKGTKIDLTFPFRGSASAPTKPSNLKVAVIRDKSEQSKCFLAFCDELCRQFGAKMLGDATELPRLLDEAQLVLIAGEATSEPSKQREVAQLLKSQPAKASDTNGGAVDKGKQRLHLELPNRAYSDMPSSLQPERKQVMIDDVPAISIHRPFTLPDLEVLEEIFDGTFAEQRKRGCALHKVSRGSQRGSPASSPEGSDEKLPFAPGAGGPESGPFQAESRRSSESTTRSVSEPQASGVSRTDTEHQGTPHPPGTKSAGQSQPQPKVSDAPPSSDKLTGHQKRPFQCLVVEDNDLNLRSTSLAMHCPRRKGRQLICSALYSLTQF